MNAGYRQEWRRLRSAPLMAHLRALCWAVVLTILLMTPAATLGDEPGGFRLTFSAEYRGGPVDGHWQTPAGGAVGSTTVDRPEIDEFGIDWANMPRLGLSGGWGRHGVYVEAQAIDLHGSGVLDITLESQNQVFPAGTRVRANLDLDWYRAGYTYTQPLDLRRGGEPELLVSASAGALLLSADFELRGEDEAAAHRSYNKIGPQLGAGVAWRAADRLWLAGALDMSLPISDRPMVISAELAALFEVFRNDAGQSGRLKLGIGTETVEFDDESKQEEPNEINMDFGPLLLLGVEITL